jgi:gliding motility-associated lipoprotein GldD
MIFTISPSHQFMRHKSYFFLALIFLFSFSCKDHYVPKPWGYFRIDLPVKEYRRFDTSFPYAFEYPVYSKIVKDSSSFAEPYWINIVYAPFHAQLHISYKQIKGNLKEYLEDSRTLVNKHIPKANAISQREYADPVNKVYGLVYNIKGSDAASTYQFYLTDSTRNFLRGALYFDLVPNNDSLAPVIDFLKKDIEHFISTFRWKAILISSR